MDRTHRADDLYDMLAFNVRTEAPRSGLRIGELILRGHDKINTPTFVATTSRGVIPHLTPDVVQKHTSILAVYVGLEDFLEKSRQDPPILSLPRESTPDGSILRAYTSLPQQCISILGSRRMPAVDTPHQSTNSSVPISTSFGFATLEVEDYNKATWRLKPDVSATILDLVQADKISRKRIEKSADRTHAWLRDTLSEAENLEVKVPLFASVPPLEPEQQSFYLSDLEDEFRHHLSGICVYEPATVAALPVSLAKTPRLCLSDPQGPHDLLTAIGLGVDLMTVPFVTAASEAGIAFTFTFHPRNGAAGRLVGDDMWSPSNTTDVSPLALSCPCYACTRHHRAYVHHLLQAKEMLAWTLLQIHNFSVIDRFYKDVSESICQGTFESDSKTFRMAYEAEMPLNTGLGPRIRGYQMKSVGRGESKKNSKAYNNLDEQARKIEEAESGVASPSSGDDAEILETQGLGQKLE